MSRLLHNVLLGDSPSPTGENLAEALAEAGVAEDALLVNWTGAPRAEGPGLVLNARSRTNKLAQLVQLELQRVPVPEFRLSPPQGLAKWWLPRTCLHKRGEDFRGRAFKPDFWVKFVPTDTEWRLHFFKTKAGNIKLLRSAEKKPKVGVPVNPLFRSHRLGWRLSYTGGAPERVVTTGRAAIRALALDFGAVDIGVSGGAPVVFEVNTCPGLEGPTLSLYVREIQNRLEG